MSEKRSRPIRSKPSSLVPWRKLALVSSAVALLAIPLADAAGPAVSTVRSVAAHGDTGKSRPAHLLAPAPAAQAGNEEPIAYIGHGAFFDKYGRQIVPTAEFVSRAQSWYRGKLLAGLNARQRAAFSAFEQRLGKGLNLGGQAKLIVRQRALNWLTANSPRTTATGRIQSKLNALAFRLQWRLPVANELKQLESLEPFPLSAKVQARLKQPEFNPGGMKTPTTNSGAAYTTECINAGVPIPPSIGDLTPGNWVSRGFIPQAEQFIVGTPAEVRTFENAQGMCVALPRYTNNFQTTVALDGVICLSKTTSKVCFWDNQMLGNGFTFATGAQIPIGVANLAVDPMGRYQAGGAEIEFGDGGVCTDCHAGENPYIIHPDSNLGTVLMGDLGNAPLNLPTFGPNRYDPLVGASWPQNALSHAQPLVPGACVGCHVQGSAGRFPHLSSDLPGYCGTILAQALTDTMPLGSPGSQAGQPAITAFQAYCGTPPSAGPSNRGDPHLTTTNNIHYDFQAAGEFTSLRNSDTGFELQTRQTPVLTTFTPGPNPYTGLQSCVSLNTAAALRVAGRRISYQPSVPGPTGVENMQLRVDGRLVSLPLPTGGFVLGGGNRIANAAAGGGIDVRMADGSRVIITPNYWSSQGYWYLDVEVLNSSAREGTMGTILPSNWLPLAPNGSSFGPAPGPLLARHNLLNGTFANAWRVTSSTSLFDYAAGTSTASFTNPNWPPPPGSACTSIPSGGFPWPGVETRLPVKPLDPEEAKRACSRIQDTVVFDQCVFDVTVTGNAAMANGYVTTLQLRNTP